ncbi:hypothetical protein G7051_00515 [Dysgonomonas sp. HDW5B]|nr:hypothetical protein [Dysgonomonas sp. HDW5B]QIK52908.1 hypothetical protein G7051_00515 [Dysgonomonas sp. HDW5B]
MQFLLMASKQSQLIGNTLPTTSNTLVNSFEFMYYLDFFVLQLKPEDT